MRWPGERLLTLRDIAPALAHPDLPLEQRMVYYDLRSHRRVAPEWGCKVRPVRVSGNVAFVDCPCPPSGAGLVVRSRPASPMAAVPLGDGLVAIVAVERRGSDEPTAQESHSSAPRVRRAAVGEATGLTGREMGLFARGTALIKPMPVEATGFTSREVGLFSRGSGGRGGRVAGAWEELSPREVELLGSGDELLFPLFSQRELHRMVSYPEDWAEGPLLLDREVELLHGETCSSRVATSVSERGWSIGVTAPFVRMKVNAWPSHAAARMSDVCEWLGSLSVPCEAAR